MARYEPELKKKVIRLLQKGKLPRQVAQEMGISLSSILKWRRRYNASEDWLEDRRIYGNARRVAKKDEEVIIATKERKPCITVNGARRKLKTRGINLSSSTIWRVWTKYGLAGFDARYLTPTLSFRTTKTSLHRLYQTKVSQLIEKGKLKEAARLVNKLPSFPYPQILLKLPERELNINYQRALLGRYLNYPAKYCQKAKHLRKLFEAKQKYYSALLCGLHELLGLQWMGRAREGLKLLNHLWKLTKIGRCKYISFILHYYEAIFHLSLMEVKKAKKMVTSLERKWSRVPSPYFLGNLASIFAFLGNYKKVKFYIEQCVRQLSSTNEQDALYRLNLAMCNTISGDFPTAKKLLKNIPITNEQTRIMTPMIKAMIALFEGNFHNALFYCHQGLQELKKRGIAHYIHSTTFIEAAVYAASNDRLRANEILARYERYLLKHQLNREVELRRILRRKFDGDPEFAQIKFIKLLLMLKKSKGRYLSLYYNRAVQYARRYGLTGYFYLFTLFYPEAIKHRLAKGKNVALPYTMLRFPIFRQDRVSYLIKFLGPLRVYRSGRSLREQLPPKLAALCIYLALAQGRNLTTEEVCRNLWPRAKNPHHNLSRALIKLRKFLKLSNDQLKIRHRHIFMSEYIATDYQEFYLLLARAKAFEGAGEWNFARLEYLRAFNQFKGEPFKKMFDNYSDRIRREVLSRLEKETIYFVQKCLNNRNLITARKVLKKIDKIIPASTEINRLLTNIKLATHKENF
ncbi:hypothetical protein BXT86_02920 [candidate division WOR-3 bacterium 4484_100]|uniref:Uncharacterized protein n=1 Tax=candidate division WOR-3 bacterium 4484_100 TaxID=1936077 RepID=A0A1V4QFU2_UNCW3|nr:MAG: hypothetical protein BXT86_02920 [candidate division WOR-3 bacterium 4484_100]